MKDLGSRLREEYGYDGKPKQWKEGFDSALKELPSLLQDSEKISLISGTIDLASDWCEEQVLPKSQICMSALKDIRNIVRRM